MTTHSSEDPANTALSHRKKSNVIWMGGATVAGFILVVGAAAWLSPTWTPNQVARAASVSDTSKLEELIDFSSVQKSVQQTLFSLYMTHDNPMNLAPSELTPLYEVAAQITASELVRPAQVINLFTDRPTIASIGSGVDLRGVFTQSDGREPQYRYDGGYVDLNTYAWRATKLDDPGTVFTIYAKRRGFGWQIISINGQTARSIEEAFTASSSRPDPQPSYNLNDESPVQAQPVRLAVSDQEGEDEQIWALYEHEPCGDMVGPERTGCWETEQEIQDSRLNTEYAAVQPRLDPAGKERLRQLQLTWIKARDKTCSDPEFGYGAWATAACLTEETAKRRLFLQNYQP